MACIFVEAVFGGVEAEFRGPWLQVEIAIIDDELVYDLVFGVAGEAFGNPALLGNWDGTLA